MPLTPEQQYILTLTGDLDPATGQPPAPGVPGIVALTLPAAWSRYADRAPIAPRLQSLYVFRDSIDMLLGVVQDETSFSIGQGAESQQRSDFAARLRVRRTDVQTEINRIEARAQANRVAQVGQLLQTAPIFPPDPTQVPVQSSLAPPDANDPSFAGSPYWSVPADDYILRPI